MKSFRRLTFAAFAAATVPRLAHRGMFVDGVTYASIARNLAAGRGSSGRRYTATLYPQFHEHPPLGFWLQSLWFRVFGDHLFVERLYALTAGLVTAGLMMAIWRRFDTGDRQGRSDLDWLPAALWIAVPVVSWALVGNLLETTVALFTTAAVAAAWRASVAISGAGPASRSTAVAWSVVSGICIAAACLTKGPVGLFPLVAPAAFLLLPSGQGPEAGNGRGRSVLHIIGQSAVQWTTVAACALLVWHSDVARASLTAYVNQQVIPALAGGREVSGSSITIVKMLLQGVLLPLAGAAILTAVMAGRYMPPSRSDRRRALSFFLIGLSGTLPILASPKQAGHYLVPAVPLFALAGAFMIGPTVYAVAEGLGTVRRRHAIDIVSALLVLGTVAASLAPGIGRDRDRLADLDAMDSAVPRDRIVSICPDSNDDWGLHAWFERRFHVGLDATTGGRPDWFLQTTRDKTGCVPAGCVAASDPQRQLVMMKCRRSDGSSLR